MSELRNFIRIHQRIPITLQAHGRQLSGQTRDIGLGGLLVTCDQSASLGTIVTASLHYQSTQPPLQLHGVIVRHDTQGLAIRITDFVDIASRENMCVFICHSAVNKSRALAEVAAYREHLIRSR